MISEEMKNYNAIFEKVYNDTYKDLLKFIIIHCSNFNDANDILQDTYIKLFELMSKKEIEDIRQFLYGITKNMIKKHKYRLYRLGEIFISDNAIDTSKDVNLKSNLELEDCVVISLTIEDIWKYIQSKKTIIGKVFYLYYSEDMTIKQISSELKINESTVKNYLYRTKKELNKIYKEKKNEK